jgi:type II restriction enzyme
VQSGAVFAACTSDRLTSSKVNTQAIDFVCPECAESFQLKSFKTWNRRKIVDAAYDSMLRAIRSDRAPNLLIMQYSSDWLIRNLLLVPHAFFTETVIEKRPPLSSGARRAGWVGCNILLERIPEDGKISIVSEGSAVAEQQVRHEFSRIRKLAEVPPTVRGWTLDVLGVIRKLGKSNFSLREVYLFEADLQRLHPKNQNVRPKIRQQLQVLRRLGLISFTSPGSYEVRR